MKPILIGYQYGLTQLFIGEYEFHNNLDKEEIHLPPNTTLVRPPAIPNDKVAIWKENIQSWELIEKPNV